MGTAAALEGCVAHAIAVDGKSSADIIQDIEAAVATHAPFDGFASAAIVSAPAWPWALGSAIAEDPDALRGGSNGLRRIVECLKSNAARVDVLDADAEFLRDVEDVANFQKGARSTYFRAGAPVTSEGPADGVAALLAKMGAGLSKGDDKIDAMLAAAAAPVTAAARRPSKGDDRIDAMIQRGGAVIPMNGDSKIEAMLAAAETEDDRAFDAEAPPLPKMLGDDRIEAMILARGEDIRAAEAEAEAASVRREAALADAYALPERREVSPVSPKPSRWTTPAFPKTSS